MPCRTAGGTSLAFRANAGLAQDRAEWILGGESAMVDRLAFPSVRGVRNKLWGPIRRMELMRPNLPDFSAPPVVEVALGVQFEPLTGLRTVQVAVLWHAFRERFPRTEEHQPLEPMFERFGIGSPRHPEFMVQMLQALPVPRFWFLNGPGTELIQVQQDRFIHNWRKVGDGDEYPRYEHLRDTFAREWSLFCPAVEKEGLGRPTANQCEITYVNQIRSVGWERHGQIGDVVTVFDPAYSDRFLGEPEDARLAVRYIIPGENGEPAGRLHVQIEPGVIQKDGQPMFHMVLTARGSPIGEGVEGILRFLDLGREWIVRSFASMTTSHMHQIWGRRDES